MNWVFFIMVAAAFAVTAAAELGAPGTSMEALSGAMLKAAEGAVPLALGLVGVMGLFLGLMKVAEEAGLVAQIARLLTPLLRRLFPEVPAGHPAMGAMVMNVAANLLGLGNAATPFGIRAMEQLQRLNPHPERASNAQALFLALNTASVTILPSSVIALRAASGSANPAAVVAPTLAATLISAVVAVAAAKLLAPLFPLPAPSVPVDDAEADHPVPAPLPGWMPAAALATLLAVIPLMAVFGQRLGHWIVPALMVGMLGWGLARRVRVYECFVDGAREGFTIAVRVIPYLVAILVAIAMLRQSGALDLLLRPLAGLLAPLGVPAEALTMAGLRSLSGSGSFGLLAAYMKDPSIGPDSPAGILLGTIYGSSETTFYVLAVYFGAVGIRRMRHALAAGLIADAAGLAAAVAACGLLLP